jgi:hypothetical protein
MCRHTNDRKNPRIYLAKRDVSSSPLSSSEECFFFIFLSLTACGLAAAPVEGRTAAVPTTGEPGRTASVFPSPTSAPHTPTKKVHFMHKPPRENGKGIKEHVPALTSCKRRAPCLKVDSSSRRSVYRVRATLASVASQDVSPVKLLACEVASSGNDNSTRKQTHNALADPAHTSIKPRPAPTAGRQNRTCREKLHKQRFLHHVVGIVHKPLGELAHLLGQH